MERASSPYSHNSIPESLEEKYHTNYIYDQAPRVECDDQFHRPFTYFDHVNRTPYEDLEAKSSGSSITFLSNSIPSQEFFFPYQCDKTGQPKRMDVSKGFYRREHKTDKRILWEKYRRQRLWKKLNDRVRYNRALLPEIIGKIKSSESLTYTEADLNRIRIPRYEGPERQLHLQSLPDIYKHVRGIKPSKKFKRQPLKTGLWPSVRHFEDSEGSIWSFQAEDDVKSHPIKNATSKEIPMKRDTKLSIGQPRSSIYLSVDGFNESKDGKDGKLESIASSKPESTTKPEEVPTEQKWDVCSNRETPSNSSSDSDLDISSMTGEPSTVDDSSVTSESIELPLLVTNRHIYSSSSIEQLNKHKNTETSKEHLEMCLKEYLVNFTEKEVEEVYRKIMSDAHSSKSVHLQEENLPSGAERKEPVCPKLAQSVADDKGYKKKVSCTHFSQLPDESTVESISSQEERTVQFPHPLTINDLNNMILVDTEKIPDFESHLPPDKINLPSLKRKLFSHKRKHAFSLKNSKNMKYSLKITHKLVPEPFSGRVFSHKKPLFTLDLEDVIVQSAYRPINQYAGEIVTRLQLPIEQMRLLDDQSSVTSISEDEQGEENYVLKLRKEVQRREMQRAEMRLSPQYTTKYLGPKMGTTLLKRQQLNRITKEYTHQVLDRSDRKVYSRDLTVAMRDGRLKFKMGIAGTSEYLDEADDTIEFFTMPPIFHTTFELDANAQWIEPNAERRSSEESADINLFRSVLTEQYEAEAKSAEEAKQDSKGVNFKSTKRKSISKSPSSYPNENDSLHGQMSVTKNVSDDFIQNVGISKGLKQRAPMPMHCWIKAKKDIRKLLKFKIERPQQTEDDEESYVFKKKRFSHKTSVMNLRQFIREQEFNYPLDIALETEKLYENMKIDSFYDSDNNLQFYYPYDSHLSYKPGVVNIDYMALLFEERQRSIASSSEAEEDEGPSDNDSQWNVRKVYHQEAPILSDRDSESFDEDVILICDCPDATKIGVESVGSDSDKSVSLMFKMFMRDNPGQGFEDAYTTCRANIFKTIEGTTKGGDTEQIVFMADKKDSDEKLYTGDKDNDNDSDESNVSVELKKNMRLKYIEKLRGASVGEIAKKQVAADEKSKMGVMKQITKSAIKKIGIADDSGTIVSSTDSTIGMSQAHLSGNYSISIDPLDNAATQEVEVEKPFIHEEFVKAKSSSSSMSTGEYRIENGLPVKQVIKKRLNRGYNTLLRVLVKTEMTHLNRMRFKSTFNKPYKCLNIWSRTNRAIKTFQKKSEKPLDKNAVLPLSEFPPLVSNSQIAETEIAKKFNENIGSFEVQVNNIINKNTFGNIQSLPESALVPKVPTKEPKIVNLRWHYFPAMQAKRFEGYEKGPIADKLRESFDQDLLYSLVKVLEVPGQETNDQPRPAGREDRLSVVSSSEIIVQEVVAKPGRKKTEIQHGGGISLVDDPKIVETYLKEMQRMDKLDKRSKTGEVKAKGKRPFTHIKNFARHSLFMQATEHADNEKLFKWNDCIKCWIAKFSDIRNLIVPYLRMERRNINQMVIKCSHENDNSQFNSTIDMEAKKKSAQYNMDWIFSKKMRFPTLSSLYKIQDKQLFCVKNPYHEPYLYKIKEMHLGMKIGRYLKKEHGIQAQDIIPPEMILSYKHEKSIFMYPGIHFLPLEIFDNQSYDIRSREEWMELGWSRDEHCFGVPAIAFVPSGNYQLLKQRYIHHFWTDVIVYDYDPKNDCFAVFPCSATHGPYLLKRIYICFIGENPVVYCDRIASAVALRNHAEYQLRFRFFKDSVDISVDEKYEEMSSRLKQILEETASKQPNLSDVSTELMAQWNDMFRKVVISKLVDKFVASGKGGEIYYLPIEDPRPYQWGANKTFDCNEDESFKEDLSESDVNMVEDDSEECPTDANPFLVYKKGESAPPCTCKRILTRDMDSETIHKSTHVSEKQVMQLRKQHELVCGMKGGLYQNKKCLCFVGEKFRKGIGPDGKPTATWATKETLLRFILQKHTDVLYEKMYPGHVEKKTLFKTTMGKIRRRGKTVLIKSKSKKPVNIDISISTQGESATGDTLFNLDQLSIVRTNYKKMAKKLEDVNNEVYLADVGLNHTCSELSMDSVRNVSRQPSPCYDGYDPNGKHSDSNTSKEQAHSITPEAVQSNSAINQHGTNVVDDTNKTLTKDVEQYHWKTHSEIDVATMSEYDPLQRQPSIPSVDRFDLAGYMKKKRAKEKTLICKDRVERSSRESVQLRSRPDTRNSSEMNKPRRYRKEKVMKSIVRRNNEAIDNEQKAKMKNVRIDTTTKTNSFTKLSRNTESPPRKNISKHRQHEEVQTNDDNYTNQQTDVLNYHAQTSHNIPKMAKSEKRSKGLKRISVLASPFTKRAMRSKSNIDNLLSQIEIDPVIEVLINPDNSVKSIIRSAAEDVLDNNTQVKTMKRGKLKDRKGKHLLKMQYKEEINNTLSKLQDKLTARLQNLNYSSEGTEDREIESNGPSDVKRQEVKYNSSTPVRLPSVITTELESQKISSEDSLPTFHPRESAKAIGLLGPSSLLRDQQQSTPKKYTAPLLKHPTKTKEREVEPKKKLNKKVPTVKKKRTVKVQLKNNLPDKTRDTETCKTTTHKDTKQKGNQSKSCKQEDKRHGSKQGNKASRYSFEVLSLLSSQELSEANSNLNNCNVSTDTTRSQSSSNFWNQSATIDEYRALIGEDLLGLLQTARTMLRSKSSNKKAHLRRSESLKYPSEKPKKVLIESHKSYPILPTSLVRSRGQSEKRLEKSEPIYEKRITHQEVPKSPVQTEKHLKSVMLPDMAQELLSNYHTVQNEYKEQKQYLHQFPNDVIGKLEAIMKDKEKPGTPAYNLLNDMKAKLSQTSIGRPCEPQPVWGDIAQDGVSDTVRVDRLLNPAAVTYTKGEYKDLFGNQVQGNIEKYLVYSGYETAGKDQDKAASDTFEEDGAVDNSKHYAYTIPYENELEGYKFSHGETRTGNLQTPRRQAFTLMTVITTAKRMHVKGCTCVKICNCNTSLHQAGHSVVIGDGNKVKFEAIDLLETERPKQAIKTIPTKIFEVTPPEKFGQYKAEFMSQLAELQAQYDEKAKAHAKLLPKAVKAPKGIDVYGNKKFKQRDTSQINDAALECQRSREDLPLKAHPRSMPISHIFNLKEFMASNVILQEGNNRIMVKEQKVEPKRKKHLKEEPIQWKLPAPGDASSSDVIDLDKYSSGDELEIKRSDSELSFGQGGGSELGSIKDKSLKNVPSDNMSATVELQETVGPKKEKKKSIILKKKNTNNTPNITILAQKAPKIRKLKLPVIKCSCICPQCVMHRHEGCDAMIEWGFASNLMGKPLGERRILEFPTCTCEKYVQPVQSDEVDTTPLNVRRARNALKSKLLLTKPEIFTLFVSTVRLCEELTRKTFFDMSKMNLSTLEAVCENLNRQRIELACYINGLFRDTIKINYCVKFQNVKKGYYCQKESDWDVYNISNTPKFLRMIRYLIETSLRILLLRSLSDLENYIVKSGRLAIAMGNDFEWVYEIRSRIFDESRHNYPSLFILDLKIGPEGPFYSTSIDTHIEKLQSLIDKAAMVCHNVPLIDMDVNEKLHYKTPISYNCYGMGELEVVQTKFLIEYVMRKLEIVLNSFRKRWGVYQDFFCMDLHSQIEQIMEKCTYSQELEFELSRQYTLLDEYQYIIPEVTNIGPFAIVTAKIKYYLLEKRTELINGLLNAYSAKLRKKTKEIIAKYNETYQKVQEKTRNIEHLVNQREWMETIPRYFSEIEESIYRHLKEYDIFDRFHHNLLDEDLNMKWMVIGWPEKILEAIHDQQEIFDDDIAVFRKIQSEDEVAIQERIEHLSKSIAAVQLQDEKTKVHEIAQEVSKIWKLLRDTVDWGRVLNNRQRLFGDKVTPFTELTTLTKTFTPFKNLWATASDWLQTADMFLDNPIMNIDPSTIEGIVNEHAKTMTKCIKLFSEIPACLKIAETIKELIEEFKPHIPIIQALCAKGMRKRHWEEFQTMTGIPINWTPALTYKECINLGVHECGEALVVISDQAKKEYVIEVAIDKMVAEWENCLAQFSPFKNSDTYIFKLSDEVFQMLEDHIETTQSLQFSPSKGPFEGILEEWAKKLTMTQKILEKWVLCQQNFMYLYPIFTSVDISTQLVHESKKFANVLRMWRKLMTDFRANPQVMNACCDHKVHDLIGNCIRAMNLILSGLNQYLHIKRNGFPRFYFLSDEELVEILSKCSDPLAVQPHLKKCFENIYSLSFDSKNNITAMFSGEDEEVKLKYELKPTGSVDNWLSDVERLMRETIQTRIIGALNAFTQKKVKSDRNSWVLNWPGQVIIVSSQIIWTNNVEICITKGNLHSYYVTQLGYLDNLRSLIRGELTKLQRLSVSALIVIDVHARDVTEMLLKKIILDVHEFDWSKQLRFYFIQNTVALRAINAEFPYGYEYLGNTGRLVITPLTDRCYLTLIGALHLKFGGAPAGPAGTGKTETTKDLAKAFAVQCVVFNCSDQLNFMAMGKFFKGLATCGAWACFDEFNRIDIEVLSVVAQQITTIQRAQMARQETFIFEGEEISLKPSCAVFVTMNPGYAGRTELPDNLKALFRPVAMMVPDYTLIAEISLFSFGFTEARLLAAKITSTFKLSSEQLSTQDHYDFGMRAVKTVIAVAGNLKKEDPQFNETLIVLRALKDVNIPKFLSDDLKLFTNILSDLFPNVVDPPIDYGVFQKTIEHILDSMILYKSPQYIIKVIQLYDTTVVRHGLMLVGPAGTGKTRCYRVLQSVMGKLKGTNSHSGGTFQNVEVSIINPKAINMGQIYGEYDLQTHEWSDGVLAKFMREGAAAADEIKRWYMFDGPVDAVWIENMNTLLDDNKKLCLTSGEIIKMTDKMTMMFEVSDLSVASPATVSRCGMVYLEPSMITLDMLINCWSKSIPKDASHISISLDLAIRRYMLPAISFLRSNLHEIVKSTDCGLMSSALKLIGYFLRPFAPEQGKMPPADKVQVHLKKLATMWVIWSTIWSIGATCNLNEREKFSVLMNKLIHKNDKELKFPKFFVYDYWIHDGGFSMLTDSGDLEKPRWMHWLANVPLYEIPPASRFIDIEVPTIDSIRNATVLGKLIENNQHVLVIGPTGSGKTITILSKINRNMPEQFVSDFMTFTAKTSLNQTRDTIESKLEKRKKLVLGPPVGKKGILFIDDFNMPAIEKFGAQPPLELIRQYMDFGGWYDTKIVGAFKHVDDMCLIGAMGPPGGGRNKISERLVRHFHLLAYPEFSHNCRKIIFGTILNYWMANMRGFLKVGEKILDMTLKLYNVIEKELLPTPKKTHYTYNLRDLSRVFQGILLANSDDIKTIEELLVLWIHECTRVFSDRLINNEDKQWFKKKIRHEIDEAFQMDYNFLTTHDPILFGDFMSFLDTSNYVQITDFEKLSSVMNSYLQSYNKTSTAPMSLVLFMDAIEHVCRIVRIIKQPQTNGLLLGIGGSGRRSLTKLSAFMTDHTCVTVEPTRSYGVAEWRDDLKKMMYYSGVNNRETVFLFSDSQIIHESFLEDINSMLNTGDVPNIYLPEDLDKIYAAMRNVVIDSGLAVTKANLFSHYLKSARTNLHIIFTMSPIGENFRSRLRQFPALINCCTIDWFNLWPDTALETVAAQYVKTCGYFTNESNELIDGVVHSCKFIHLSVVKMADLFFEEYGRRTYISPTKYLILLHTYVNLMFKTRNSDEELLGRYHTGLEKLLITAEEVNELREAIKDMQPVLKESRRRAMEVAEKIDNDRMEAEKTKVIVAEEEAKAQVAQEETTQYAAETEKDLEKAMPTLRKAEAALMSINKKDITEVKAMKRPPAPVVLVMEVLCLIKNIPPNKIPGKLPGERVWDYWEPARNMLSDPGLFLKSLLEFDRDSMTEETIKKIEPYIKNPKFTAKNIKAASIACKSLFTWISAIYDYYFINKTVAPKRAAYNEAKNKLEECQRALERSRFRMKKVMDGLVELEARLAKTQARVQTLEENEQNGIMKLELAEELLVSLDDEKKRWIENASQITSSALTQIGNLLICAATVAYFGPFSDDYRRALQIEWTRTLTALKVPNDSDLEPVHILSNPLEIRRWQLSGLPKDFSSTENAILSSSSLRFPLFIDPTGQANKWIKGTLRETRLIVQKFGTKELMRELEGAISFGRTILIENIGLDIDPILDPILNKQIFPYRGNDCVKFGENIIPFNDRFMIYFTTRLRNPTYSPEICSKVNIINFTLSIGGLEDQLLSLVVSCKRPDLEEQKSRLVESTAEMKIEIKNLEDKILNLISSATGSPLDDLNLIEALKQSKEKSENIREKVDVASKTAKSIDETRIGYAPVARRAQILYFCLADMAKVDPMYQYSLDWFTNIFTLSLTQTEKSTNSEERNISVNNHFTYSLFMNVSRSLFEKNRLQFTFLICIRIMIEKKQITKEEFEFFLTGGKPKKTIPAPSGFPEQRWMEILGLETLPQFEVLINTIVANSDEWKFLIDDPNPYKQHFPMSFHLKLSVFQRLMLIRFARPDKLIDSIQDYISSHIGTKYIEPLPKNVASLYTDSTPLTPLLFVLSPGTDPAADFLSFAEKQSMVKKVMAISLGQGQGPIAEEMFNKAVQIGGWIFFQNCHLAPSWMPRLEQLIEGLPFDFVHKDFRIWLTSTPSEYFPSSILENGNKMTIEPPRGVKANLLRAYTGHVMEYQDFINSEEPKAPIFKGLLFALCLFHAIVLERRKFGPLGFNIPYEFTDGDLRISINQLHMFVMEYESIPYKVLSHTAGDINYGGRVTDDWDRRCIRCLLSEFYNPKTQTENYMFDLFAYYYQLPFNSQLSNYMAYIKELPINDETTLFGLHSNANISYSQGEASEAIKMLLSLQPQKTGKAAATQDAKVAVIAKETLLTVPGPFMDLDKIQEKYPVMYEESLNTVLYQEILRYNRLLFVIQESCHDLLKALDGVVVMSEHLEKMSQSLYLNQVPEMWAIKCYPSLMPLAAWCKDLKKRIRFLKKWIDSGRPANFWISGFFFPQAFLTAILQNYARTHIVSVDAISYLFIFLDELPRERKADGCVIYGLFLEGARWIQEKYKLSESVRKILFTEMSPIWLRPNENVIKDVVQVYNCPVYKTLKRVGTLSTTGHSTNYVLTIDLPTKKTNAHWVLRGVALFCALDYC